MAFFILAYARSRAMLCAALVSSVGLVACDLGDMQRTPDPSVDDGTDDGANDGTTEVPSNPTPTNPEPTGAAPPSDTGEPIDMGAVARSLPALHLASPQDGEDPGDPGDPPDDPADPAGEESLCHDEIGTPIPYDYSRGLTGEYAFEVSFDCSVGGYLAPIIDEDPIDLTGVTAFVDDLTDWYRTAILRCDGSTTDLAPDVYGFLPAAQAADVSSADIDASVAVFMLVLDRHEGQADGVSADTKALLRARLEAFKNTVENPAEALTKRLLLPECE